jgi:hypothetical protein
VRITACNIAIKSSCGAQWIMDTHSLQKNGFRKSLPIHDGQKGVINNYAIIQIIISIFVHILVCEV